MLFTKWRRPPLFFWKSWSWMAVEFHQVLFLGPLIWSYDFLLQPVNASYEPGDWVLNIEPALNSWNKLPLAEVWFFLYIVECDLLTFSRGFLCLRSKGTSVCGSWLASFRPWSHGDTGFRTRTGKGSFLSYFLEEVIQNWCRFLSKCLWKPWVKTIWAWKFGGRGFKWRV